MKLNDAILTVYNTNHFFIQPLVISHCLQVSIQTVQVRPLDEEFRIPWIPRDFLTDLLDLTMQRSMCLRGSEQQAIRSGEEGCPKDR